MVSSTFFGQVPTYLVPLVARNVPFVFTEIAYVRVRLGSDEGVFTIPHAEVIGTQHNLPQDGSIDAEEEHWNDKVRTLC